jgi:hypothetical protein
MICDVKIPFPVDENGKINLSAQQRIASTYAAFEQYKKDILEKLNTLITQKITL